MKTRLCIVLMLLCSLAAPCQRLLISELLCNPEPGGSDYVELYNAGNDTLPLDNICLFAWAGDSLSKSYPLGDNLQVAPHRYVVITTDMDYLTSHYQVPYPNQVIVLPKMPAYNDASGTVIVGTKDGAVLDRLDYDEKMHSPLLKDVEGVSLERRSFEVPTQNRSNWYSAASTAGYGTPTAPNSQSTEFLFREADFVLANEVFSPNGDGYHDQMDLTYRLSQGDLHANITLFDAAGRPIRQLCNACLLGTQGIITWDGLRDNGSRATAGRYVLVADLYNRDGRHQKIKKTVAIFF